MEEFLMNQEEDKIKFVRKTSEKDAEFSEGKARAKGRTEGDSRDNRPPPPKGENKGSKK